MKKRKPAFELTRDELARLVFPKKVLQEVGKLVGKRGNNSSRTESIT